MIQIVKKAIAQIKAERVVRNLMSFSSRIIDSLFIFLSDNIESERE